MSTFVKFLKIAANSIEDTSKDKPVFVNPHQVASVREYRPEVTVLTFGNHDHYVRGSVEDVLGMLTYGRLAIDNSRAA